MDRRDSGLALSCCHGYRVAAGGLLIGAVETPVFRSSTVYPEFLLVRTARSIAGTFRVVPVSLVLEIDRERRRVGLAGDGDLVASLPESLPLSERAGVGGAP